MEGCPIKEETLLCRKICQKLVEGEVAISSSNTIPTITKILESTKDMEVKVYLNGNIKRRILQSIFKRIGTINWEDIDEFFISLLISGTPKGIGTKLSKALGKIKEWTIFVEYPNVRLIFFKSGGGRVFFDIVDKEQKRGFSKNVCEMLKKIAPFME
jgi:hypothetical protein